MVNMGKCYIMIMRVQDFCWNHGTFWAEDLAQMLPKEMISDLSTASETCCKICTSVSAIFQGYFPRTFNDPLKLSRSILGSMMVYAKLRSIQSATDHVDVSWRPHRRSMSRAWHLYHLPHQISLAPDMASVQVTMLAPEVVSCGMAGQLGSWAAT